MFEGGGGWGGSWMRKRVGHGGGAPLLQQSVERVLLTRRELTKSMNTSPSSFRFCPQLVRSLRLEGWGLQWRGRLGGTTRGGGALSLTRSLQVSFRMYPPRPSPSLPPLTPCALAPSLFPSPPLNPSLSPPYSTLPLHLAVLMWVGEGERE